MLAKLLQNFYNTYDFVFSRKALFKWHRFLYNLSIRGMGVLTNPHRSEGYFLKKFFSTPGKKVILDVGANIGQYAEMMRGFSKDAEIYSFEPQPNTYKELAKNASALNIKAYQMACGSSNGEISIYDYETSEGASTQHASAYKDVIESIHNKQSIEFKVESVTLDTFAEREELNKIDLLKIDTEGFEMEVLKGAKSLLSSGKIELIQLEFNEMNVAGHSFLKDFMKMLPDYKFYRLMQDGFLPIDKYFAGYHEIFAFQNILAVHKTSSFGK